MAIRGHYGDDRLNNLNDTPLGRMLGKELKQLRSLMEEYNQLIERLTQERDALFNRWMDLDDYTMMRLGEKGKVDWVVKEDVGEKT